MTTDQWAEFKAACRKIWRAQRERFGPDPAMDIADRAAELPAAVVERLVHQPHRTPWPGWPVEPADVFQEYFETRRPPVVPDGHVIRCQVEARIAELQALLDDPGAVWGEPGDPLNLWNRDGEALLAAVLADDPAPPGK